MREEEFREAVARLRARIDDALLAAERQDQWAKYNTMKSSIRAACRRHLEIIRNEQERADEELVRRRRAGASQ